MSPPLALTDTASEPIRLPARHVSGCYLVRLYPPGNLAENLISLPAGETALGRDPGCELEIDDDFISRVHAKVEVDGDEISVIDQGSRNGTFVNEERVTRKSIRAGDHIRVGNHVFKFLSAEHPEVQYHEAVYEMMTTDALTGIANRRFFEDAFHRELTRGLRHQRPVGVLMIDVDHFKRINDLYGHLVGDECLREMCDRIRRVISPDELFGRVGGEEFAVVLAEAAASECQAVAERIRARVAGAAFGTARKLSIPMTISIGIAHSDDFTMRSINEFLCGADTRLYQAKREGRDCVRGPACCAG
ncbi:MAG: diguanylate cyclase [Planctomycetaceae bacterium]|nr:diguanylate cyclase [Planctomycetaceae bacterium]